MSQDGSNAYKKSAQHNHAIPAALMGAVAAIVAMLIAGGPVLLSRGGGDGTKLAAFTTSSQRTASLGSPSPSAAPSGTGSALMSNESPVCAGGTLQLLGSSAFESIAKGAATEYMRRCTRTDPSITVNMVNGVAVNNPDSAWGVSQACAAGKPASPSANQIIGMYDGRYDGLSSRCPRLRPHPIGALIFSVVANTRLLASKTNIITNGSIGTPTLRDIFIGPGLKGYVGVGRQAGSGTRKAFFMDVLNRSSATPVSGKCPMSTPPSLTGCTEESTEDLLKFVNETPNAIGYAESFLLNANPNYPDVSPLSIDGVAPLRGYVLDGTYPFRVVEHLYVDIQLTTLTRDFLAWLPSYIELYVPRDDFIVCADASKRLDIDCASAPPPSLPKPPHKSAFDILLIGSLVTLGIDIIWMCGAVFRWKRRPRVVERPWLQWLGWALALVTAAWATAWSVYFLGTGALDWVVPLGAAIGAALFVVWYKLTGHPPTSGGPDIVTRDPGVAPHGSPAPESQVTGPTPESSQQRTEPVPSAAGPTIQPDASAGRSAFVSYSHEDEQYRLQLDKWLAPLIRENLISVWHDRKILPGQDWDQEIDKNLESADIVLLLVSQDFLASEYVYSREMSRAMERHRSRSAIVVPIILRSSDWRHSPLRSLEALPSKGQPVARPDHDEAWLNVVQELRRLISSRR